MEPNRLFLRALEELRDVLEKHPEDEYRLLKCAGTLRLLLLDSPPLMDKVNKPFRLKLRFHINRFPEAKPNIMRFVLDGISPGDDPNFPVLVLDRRHFLKVETMHVFGHAVTVKDLIRHAAHSEGGVHHGRAESPKVKWVVEKFTMVIKNEETGDEKELPGAAIVMRGIIRVVVDSLAPLENAVRSARP